MAITVLILVALFVWSYKPISEAEEFVYSSYLVTKQILTFDDTCTSLNIIDPIAVSLARIGYTMAVKHIINSQKL